MSRRLIGMLAAALCVGCAGLPAKPKPAALTDAAPLSEPPSGGAALARGRLVEAIPGSHARSAGRPRARILSDAGLGPRAIRNGAAVGADRERRDRRARGGERRFLAPAVQRQRSVFAVAPGIQLVQPGGPRPAGELHLRLVGQTAPGRRGRDGPGSREPGGTQRRRADADELDRRQLLRMAGRRGPNRGCPRTGGDARA